MGLIYNTAIAVYKLGVKIASRKNRKAALMLSGQSRTFQQLKDMVVEGEKYIWMHASSLGEFEQGRPMIELIKRENPNQKILLTFFSPSGYEVRKDYPMADIICYLPFDLPSNVKRFLDIVPIERAIFIKYEFWANYLTELVRREIPTYLISAIFRPTQSFFKPYGGMFRRMLKCYNTIFVQDEQSRVLLESINITNVVIAGDTRFDRVTEILNNEKSLKHIEQFTKDNFTLIVGSSWEADEDIYIPYFNANPDIKVIIAPHNIDAERVAAITSRLERSYTLYSDVKDGTEITTDALIIDCFGILSSTYRYADVAYIGGGFGVGIHNINEAAVYAMPVIFGTNYAKFKEANDLIELEGAFSIKDSEEFTTLINRFRNDPTYLTTQGTIAGNYIRQNLGATERIYSQIID
ncbi:MAG: glycosyltransferase N-terminal domain-containing protein [Bacteroidales bacterium]